VSRGVHFEELYLELTLLPSQKSLIVGKDREQNTFVSDDSLLVSVPTNLEAIWKLYLEE